MAHLSLTWAWALVFTVSVLTVCCENDPDPWVYRVDVYHDALKPSVFITDEQWYSSTLKSIGSSSELIYVSEQGIRGFVVQLSLEQVRKLKKRPEIRAVIPDRLITLDTTRTPGFLELDWANPNYGILNSSDLGSNVIIGVVDSGIWPEHPSFHDKELGPIPSHWKGSCNGGEDFKCNKKIIGARTFVKAAMVHLGVEAQLNDSLGVLSARDRTGHGTFCASVAAGRLVKDASYMGFAQGVACGVAPKARIAVYRACLGDTCRDLDLVFAIVAAVNDGCDIISVSAGGPARDYFLDGIAVGSYFAMEKGVLVSTTSGNDGPQRSIMGNVAPWVLTAGASTVDRIFSASINISGEVLIKGISLYNGPNKLPSPVPIIYGDSCKRLEPNLVHGKVVVCDTDQMSSSYEQTIAVKNAGGVGVIICEFDIDVTSTLEAPTFEIPGMVLSRFSRDLLFDHLFKENPVAVISFIGTEQGIDVKAPFLAPFSSRGPNLISSYVMKPDLIAPGVNILGASISSSKFIIKSGTSFSCPHVSGAAALLKGTHPDWTPAMIKSAIMTTAYTNLVDDYRLISSDAWEIGSGHLLPQRTVDPGLVYDLDRYDYLEFLCDSGYNYSQIGSITGRRSSCNWPWRPSTNDPWELNYPAISLKYDLNGPSEQRFRVPRKLTQVSDIGSTYSVSITNPENVIVTVVPPTLVFTIKGEKNIYFVDVLIKNVKVIGSPHSSFGKLTWSDGAHYVTSPILVTGF